MIEIKSGELENGIREFYINGLDFNELDYYDGLLIVVDQLCRDGAKLLEQVDGIYSRIADIEMNNIVFKIIYHEDVGIYSYLNSIQSNENNEKLLNILQNVASQIDNNYK